MLYKSASQLEALSHLSTGVACSWCVEGRDALLAQELMTPSSHRTGTAAPVGKTKYNESKLQGLEGNLTVSNPVLHILPPPVSRKNQLKFWPKNAHRCLNFQCTQTSHHVEDSEVYSISTFKMSLHCMQ